MNKSSKRWKVFVIVLCMLFTMTPATVFADDLGDLPAANQSDQQLPANSVPGGDGDPDNPDPDPDNPDPDPDNPDPDPDNPDNSGDLGDQTGGEEKEKPQEKIEYITKDVNNFLPSSAGDPYIKIEAWKKCEVEHIDFKGKDVVLGVDASLTTDLTGLDMMFVEDGIFYLKAHAFLPENTLPERRERIDYRTMENSGYCTITPGDIVDYNLLKERIREVEDLYECNVIAIATDPYNITATMQELADEYEVILLKQSYSVLSAPIKQFRDDVYKGIIKYEKNKLLDWCMGNTTTVIGRASGDILLNKLNKNKTRIDMVVAAIFAYSQLYTPEEKPKELTADYINSFYSKMGAKNEKD